MQVECPSCSKRTEIAEKLVDEEGLEITCSNCGYSFFALPGGFTTSLDDTHPNRRASSQGDGRRDPIGTQEGEESHSTGTSVNGKDSENKQTSEAVGVQPVLEALEEAAEQGRSEFELSLEDLKQLEESRREFLLCKAVPKMKIDGDKLAEVLIDIGTDPNAKDEEGKPALHHAASAGRPDVVRVLIENGAEVNGRGHTANTPLHRCAVANTSSAAKLLIEKGAEVDARDENKGRTPLHLAASLGSDDVLKVLLEVGADPGSKCENGLSSGRTPLHFAAFSGEVEIAKMLISAGANVNARGEDGKTPLHRAASPGEVEMVKLLVEEGGDVDARDSDGTSPLNSAIRPGSENTLKVVKLLVEAGAALDSGGDFEGTPLHSAAFNSGPEVVEYLIEAGADVNATNEYGNTPLDHVQHRKNEGDPAPGVGRLLRREGARKGENVSRPQGCLGALF